MSIKNALPFLLIAGMLLAGCSPTKQYIVATETYNQSLSVLIEKRKAGEISDVQYRRVEIARKIVADILDEWKLSLVTSSGFRLASIATAFADAYGAYAEAGGFK